jgi:hypothetical protein
MEDVLPTSYTMFDGEINVVELANAAFPISDESLPFMETIEDQSIVDESIGGRNLTAEKVIPTREIMGNPLVLNHDVSYAFSGMFFKRTIRFDDKLNLAIPIDLRSFTDVLIPLPNLLIMKLSPVLIPPLPKPPDLTQCHKKSPTATGATRQCFTSDIGRAYD